MLMRSPPCTAFCELLCFTCSDKETTEYRYMRRRVARMLCHSRVSFATAWWEIPEVRTLMLDPRVFVVPGSQRTSYTNHVELLSSRDISSVLTGQSTNVKRQLDRHHGIKSGSRVATAAVYPSCLVLEVLKPLQRQLDEEGVDVHSRAFFWCISVEHM